MRAASIKIESEEDGFYIVIDRDSMNPEYQAGEYRWKIEDPIQLHNAVTSEIGPWLTERERGRLAFLCSPEDIDESGGYATDDPKHPDFHSIHADLWDSRAGK